MTQSNAEMFERVTTSSEVAAELLLQDLLHKAISDGPGALEARATLSSMAGGGNKRARELCDKMDEVILNKRSCFSS